tara:strand:- start:100 stop:339 length:240 start_codon:yes stop_codon:yes gene_type:complete
MKKILIGVGVLGVMSFTTNQLVNTFLLSEAINNVQDMKEWMVQDQYNEVIDSVYADYYIKRLDETEDMLIDFYNVNTNK